MYVSVWGCSFLGRQEMKVVLYARVSSEAQDVELSISAQLRALREYAVRNGHQVMREFVDEAETGRTTTRPAFREMISLARRTEKPFEQILVWKYSRFTRKREDSVLYKAMLKKAGVQVVSINEPFDDTPTGRLLEAIIESLDEFYSDNLGEEVTRGMRESASRGFYLSSRAPYGYRKIKIQDGNKERTKLEIETTEANIVREIFQGVVDGKGLTEIAKDLNTKNMPSPKHKGWGKTSVSKMLINEIYTGVFVWGKHNKRGDEPVRTENVCPAIIDREIFQKVQTMMKARMPKIANPRRISSSFLLSGLVYCGHCGKALIGKYAKSGKFAYYVCGTLDKKGSKSCLAKYLNKDKFECHVVDQIKGRILTRDNLKGVVRIVNEEMDLSLRSHQSELDAISHLTTDINQRLDHLYDAIETGKLNLEDVVLRIRELKQRQEQLQARRIEIEYQMSDRKVEMADIETIMGYVDDLSGLLRSGTLAERKAFIKSVVKEIRVTGNEAMLTYTMPILPEKMDIEKEGVLPTVPYGGR
jgi:site-specific DNA recombinase